MVTPFAQLECERVHARLGRLDRGGGSRCRVDALVERRQLLARLGRARQQLLVARGTEAALRLRDAVEAGLKLFEPPRLGLERRKERAQLGRGLAQAELDVAQLVAGTLELRRQPLERSDGPLGDRDQTGRALSVLRCERLRRRRRSLRKLGDVPQPLAVAAQPLLVPFVHPSGVLDERAQLGDPRLCERRVGRQLLVALPRRLQLAPGGAHRLAVDAREPVEQLQLVRRPREAPLLELARHGDDALDGGRDVLTRRRTAPGIRARPPVGEHAPCDEERVLVLRPQLAQPLQLVGHVELGLDVCLGRSRPDEGRVALRPEQEPDRLGEDRLPGAGLARDRVQPRRELELRLADEDEVLDAQPTQHGTESRQGG